MNSAVARHFSVFLRVFDIRPVILQICQVTFPPEKRLLPFVKRFLRRKNDCSHLPSDFSVGEMTAPICKLISPPEKWLLPFAKQLLRRKNYGSHLQNDCSAGKTTPPICQGTFPTAQLLVARDGWARRSPKWRRKAAPRGRSRNFPPPALVFRANRRNGKPFRRFSLEQQK